jgi:hypothetical protein
LLGLSKSFFEVNAILESHFSNLHKDLRKIPGQFDEISEVTEIPYVSKRMVAVFMEHVFPRVRIPDSGFGEVNLNRGYPEDMIEVMREWNAGTGVEFQNQTLMHWPSFHTLASATRLSERRHRIFGGFDALLGERDALLGERDVLLGERDALLGERDVLLGERDVLLGERDVLLGERDALINSNSWKITRPLRAFGRFARRE